MAFKQELSVLLFRVDIISLFYKMIKGPEGLDPSNSIYRDWEEFVRQIIKKLLKRLDQRPELIVEMLFSKINTTVHYLEYGYEKQTLYSQSKPAMELEVKPTAAYRLWMRNWLSWLRLCLWRAMRAWSNGFATLWNLWSIKRRAGNWQPKLDKILLEEKRKKEAPTAPNASSIGKF